MYTRDPGWEGRGAKVAREMARKAACHSVDACSPLVIYDAGLAPHRFAPAPHSASPHTSLTAKVQSR